MNPDNLPTYDEVYAFIKDNYKPSRFEGRNDGDYPDYSECVARSHLQGLESRGYSLISRHEDKRGEGCTFDHRLERSTWNEVMEHNGLVRGQR